METKIKVVDIDDYNYINNPHQVVHLYSSLLGHIDFRDKMSFLALIMTYPMLTIASAQVVSRDELLDELMAVSSHKPSNDELLEMPILDLNIDKLAVNVVTS
uniref:Uncharacterized protein n=1 Tax=Romanomermis culicivorax TaxID=13658 RepID=A0A915HV36_ROMCU